MWIDFEPPPLSKFNPEPAMVIWLEQRIRRPRKTRKKFIMRNLSVQRKLGNDYIYGVGYIN